MGGGPVPIAGRFRQCWKWNPKVPGGGPKIFKGAQHQNIRPNVRLLLSDSELTTATQIFLSPILCKR
jgi:hypothetical protein